MQMHSDAQSANITQGSRDLLRALLKTGRLYRPMTEEEIRVAMIYAYGNKKQLIG